MRTITQAMCERCGLAINDGPIVLHGKLTDQAGRPLCDKLDTGTDSSAFHKACLGILLGIERTSFIRQALKPPFETTY